MMHQALARIACLMRWFLRETFATVAFPGVPDEWINANNISAAGTSAAGVGGEAAAATALISNLSLTATATPILEAKTENAAARAKRTKTDY
jgi:hypothetical protein